MFSVYNNFLEESTFAHLVNHAREAEFRDVESGIDGVTYPLICTDIPHNVLQEVGTKLHRKALNMLFLRRSPAGVPVPNIHHNDASHGRWSLMLYLDDTPGAGTAFCRHVRTGICYAPEDPSLLEELVADSNNQTAWLPMSMCPATPNRGVVFDAGYFHRAEPLGGWGEGTEARTVLTAFFD